MNKLILAKCYKKCHVKYLHDSYSSVSTSESMKAFYCANWTIFEFECKFADLCGTVTDEDETSVFMSLVIGSSETDASDEFKRWVQYKVKP